MAIPKIKHKEFYYPDDQVINIPAGSYVDHTFDISDMGFTEPPRLVNFISPWVVAHAQPMNNSATTKNQITLRIYNDRTGSGGAMYIAQCDIVLQGL